MTAGAPRGRAPLYLAMVAAPTEPPPITTENGRLQPEARERLVAALELLNLEGAVSIASRFATTQEGGLRGVLHRPGGAIDALILLEEELRGLRLCYGIGFGSLAGSPRVTARALAGPCLEAAERALARSRAKHRWVTALGWGVRRDKILNGAFALLGAVRGEWTARQAEIVAVTRRMTSQREAAVALGVQPSVVSEALTAAHYRRVLEGEEGLRQMLEVFGVA